MKMEPEEEEEEAARLLVIHSTSALCYYQEHANLRLTSEISNSRNTSLFRAIKLHYYERGAIFGN